MNSIIKLLLLFTTLLHQTWSFCEHSYVVICDDLEDHKINDTSTWRYVVIGSNQYKKQPPNKTLDFNVIFDFSRTKSLTIIYQLDSIRPFSLLPHHQLEHLNLYDNEIKSIEDETFHDSPSLKELYLDSNKIEFLGRSIFKNTTLEVVSLQFNGLQMITSAFYDSKIEWIRLNHNEIKYIKWGAFPNNLKRLELNHNQLETLHKDVFKNLHNLQVLSIEHNKLKTLPDVSALMALQFLYLAYNDIERVNYGFGNHTKLGYIDFSSNKLRELEADVFSSNTSSAPIVSLVYNRLHDMKFRNPARKTDLVLYGNPWICDCLRKIEKTLADYGHDRTCELECFNKGTIAVCIENGECGKNEVEVEDVEKFLYLVGEVDYNARTSCDIYF